MVHAIEARARAHAQTKTENRVAVHRLLRHTDHLVALICQELEGDLLVADELHMRVYIVATHS